MKTFWLTIATASIFAAVLQGCATGPGSYGPAYTPPPGYILIPAPGNDAAYYGSQYGWGTSGIPPYYRGNPFYLPYYWYGQAPFYYVAPLPHGCRNCDDKGGVAPPPPPDSHAGRTPPRVRPPVIEPRGDRRIPPRMRNRGHRPHVPEVPALRPVHPAPAVHGRSPHAAQPAAAPVRPSMHAPNRRDLPKRPNRPRYRQPR